MRPIDKFILYVVHNLFPLNEYSEGELKKLMTQFRDEADDLSHTINTHTHHGGGKTTKYLLHPCCNPLS